MGCLSMKQKRVFLMCGIPGSGKSTWIQTQLKSNEDVWISRDQIRFSLLQKDEDYFACEEEVFSSFVNLTQQCIDDLTSYNIYVDATHLTIKARNKLLNKLLNLQNISIIPVWFNIPLDVALDRNEQRIGRAYVPPKVIAQMFTQQVPPTFSERHPYSEIWEVDESCNINKTYGEEKK